MNHNITIHDFVYDTNVRFPTVLIVAKRNAGKSFLTATVASKLQHIPRFVCFCGTQSAVHFWSQIIGSRATVYNADRKSYVKLKEIMNFQENKVNYHKNILNQEVPNKYYLGLVLDDVSSCRLFARSELLDQIFCNGRHLHIALFVTVQYYKHLRPSMRANADYLFLLHNSAAMLQIIHKEFIGELSCDVFVKLVHRITGEKTSTGKPKYNAFVFDNMKCSANPNDLFKIFRYDKNFDINNIKLGDEKFKNYLKCFVQDKQQQDLLEQKATDAKNKRLNVYANTRRRVQSEQVFSVSRRRSKNTNYNFTFAKNK